MLGFPHWVSSSGRDGPCADQTIRRQEQGMGTVGKRTAQGEVAWGGPVCV